MKSTAKSDRDWRLHPGVEPSPDSGASRAASSLAERPGTNGPFWNWRGRIVQWAMYRASRLIGLAGMTPEEVEPACDRRSPSEPCDLPMRQTDEDCPSLQALQDATFLNAVLPFAIGLARRHGESVSLLCVAIDRLGGICELLGKASADRAVDTVGQQIAWMIRTSDIVARIDDDRIIAVMPRACLEDAHRLAQEICRTVESRCARLPGLPALTVSIGVAEFPACAATVYALLDAADHALSAAEKEGRNRTVLASRLNEFARGTSVQEEVARTR